MFEKNRLTPYEFFNSSKNKALKAVEIITDNQAVFRDDEGIYSTHNSILLSIEKDIYPTLSDEEIAERENENVCIILSDYDVIIHFPDNGKISLPQFDFILDFIKDVSKYNREVSLREKKPIVFDWIGKPIKIYDIRDLKEKKLQELKQYRRNPRELRDEKIIGNMFPMEEKKGILGAVFH